MEQGPAYQTKWDNGIMQNNTTHHHSSSSSSFVQHYSNSNRSSFQRSNNNSSSAKSLHENADNMLKDLEGSLKASSHFIESHRTHRDPSGVQEYHEYRSFSNGGNPEVQTGDYNLQRQVEHMMPPGSMNIYNNSNSKQDLQSANMVSSMHKQQSNHSNTSYNMHSDDKHANVITDKERPNSNLKQNIYELDSLLDDLNKTQKISNTGFEPWTTDKVSSDDYSYNDGHTKKTKTEYNEYNHTSDYSPRKPPSPSPRRRGGSNHQPFQNVVRNASPSPIGKMTSSSYNYTSSSKTIHDDNSNPYNNYPHSYHPVDYKLDKQPSSTTYYPNYPTPDPVDYKLDKQPSSTTYYPNYPTPDPSQPQSPIAFPTTTNSTPMLGGRTKSPPKRVDELMTELSEFDSSIQQTHFVEPDHDRMLKKNPDTSYHESSPHRVNIDSYIQTYHEPSPVRQADRNGSYQQEYRSPSNQRGGPLINNPDTAIVTHTTTLEEGKGKGKSKFKAKERGRYKESSSEGGKQGAAIIPICLPFGCAAPCVIM